MVDVVVGEVVDEEAHFFAPVASDLVDGLIGQYAQAKDRIETVASFMTGPEAGAVMEYFFEGNADDGAGRGRLSLKRTSEHLFDPVGARHALNAAYWSKTLLMTDVLDVMPQKRRDEWHKQMKNPEGIKRDKYSTTWELEPLPNFEEATVRETLASLLNMRAQFLAERVDGIFRGLSGDHVTNAPEAFGKRMILAHALNEYGSSGHTKCGLINDLRCVVAKFMGRDEPKYYASSRLIETLKNRWGEWVSIDGGALKIRLYKKGTAHLEVHPDMAWRLNQILAHLYPLAIPAEFRQKPKRKVKEFALMSRPLPFAVLDLLAEGRKRRGGENTVHLSINSVAGSNKVAWAEAARVLETIGGAHDGRGTFSFDYWPGDVIDEIVTSGCIPDHKSHQFYPTPENLALKVVELADIKPSHECLEPSAGTGALAKFMPKEQTTCVEVSAMHEAVLTAQGFKTVRDDFLAWAQQPAHKTFERVLMNPPFSEGRWRAHVESAAQMLRPGGRLVAILPSGAKTSGVLGAWPVSWHGPFDNEFSGTSVSVVILVADRPKT
jgi:hypothetical protein